ncbi:MAG: Sarcosine oxidase, gamma subunit family [Pseudomonadota bacterium]|jgi:heterotetrameric sarcosine oxidase gamma subunit
MQTGRAIVTELSLSPITGQTLFRLALWNPAARSRLGAGLGADLPGPCRAITTGAQRLLWLEQDHWLVACATTEAATVQAQMAGLIGSDGTIVEVGAALVGHSLSGGDWRGLLMVGGVFDAEDPGFGPGSVARTVMHHSPLLLDVIAADHVNAYVPASYAGEFFDYWRAEIVREAL